MIASEFRAKGGASQLGARQPGERGPFGEYGSDEDGGEQQPRSQSSVRTTDGSATEYDSAATAGFTVTPANDTTTEENS
ncbi:hypothetical protein [Streptomyces mirabilis]|uniref:hypothetical protein n=1 Tax=Streptomyces mirabilis TaxID=68239 RepID=UPI0036DBD308